jgi:hypothetical protein
MQEFVPGAWDELQIFARSTSTTPLPGVTPVGVKQKFTKFGVATTWSPADTPVTLQDASRPPSGEMLELASVLVNGHLANNNFVTP